jgi:hypothetical protein
MLNIPAHLACPLGRITSVVALWLCSQFALAGSLEQAKRLHERLTGVPPSPTTSVLADMAALIAVDDVKAAAYLAMRDNAFYDVTLVNWAAPWTNRDRTVFVPLNDYTATVVGLVRDEGDFRELLFENILYAANDVTPAYAPNSNAHYEEITRRALPLKTTLVRMTQQGIPAEATAGVITSRAASKAFFIAGTNRAQLRFTLLNHLCHDLEQLHDVTLPPDRIRQDVSRSPGGDSRAFLNGCMGCHTGMDPLAQAFAYYNYSYDAENDLTGENGQLQYNAEGMLDVETGTRVQAKYHFNSATFTPGFITLDDHWDNYWREGVNANLGWDQDLPGSGVGAKSMAKELAYSEAFASCQASKVFKAMCFRDPANVDDSQQIESMVRDFKQQDYNAKELFADAAIYCMGK